MKKRKSLLIQLNSLLTFSLVAGVGVATTLGLFLTYALNEYYVSSDYAYVREKPLLESFQSFVEEHELNATDAYDILDWIFEEKPAYLSIAREDVLLFDYAYQQDMIGMHSFDLRAYSYRFNSIYAFQQPIRFADGEAEVYIDDGSMQRYYLGAVIVSGVTGFGLVLVVIALAVRRQIRQILVLKESVSLIEEGVFSKPVRVESCNEIGVLADEIEQMRLALVRQKECREEAEAELASLVMGIAHDLRTPLTVIMNCHSLIRTGNSREEEETLLDRADEKIKIISDLSEELMHRFSDKLQEENVFLPARKAEYCIWDYLSNIIALLHNDGFCVDISNLHLHDVDIRVDDRYMARIADNIYSNLKKYAVKGKPIVLSTSIKEEGAAWSICFHNICFQDAFHRWKALEGGISYSETEEHGIGIRNIRRLMMQMGGEAKDRAVEWKDGSYTYWIELIFPICPECCL